MYNFRPLREASRNLSQLDPGQRTAALIAFADLLQQRSGELIAASAADIQEHGATLPAASLARLLLDTSKMTQIVTGVRQVAGLKDPVGAVQQRTVLDDGLELERIAVPLGVFGIIFESRADVAPQIMSLALRSANAVVLKGGSETKRINSLYGEIAAAVPGLPEGWFQLHHQRDVVDAMLNAAGEIDLLIPRGSNELVQSIIERSRVPVLGHADGVCHIFVDKAADLKKALAVILDAKTQYPAACNAVETVLVDHAISTQFIPLLIEGAAAAGVELRGDASLQKFLPQASLVSGDRWHTEYGEKILAVAVSENITAAISHINSFGSHHTDCIISENSSAIEQFFAQVDSANVYSNCSTRFADGFRYGFGAEIGISTGRIHARGPVGMDGLMTYKYLLRGAGQTVAQYSGESPRPFKHIRTL